MDMFPTNVCRVMKHGLQMVMEPVMDGNRTVNGAGADREHLRLHWIGRDSGRGVKESGSGVSVRGVPKGVAE